jgi:hypothetical protein
METTVSKSTLLKMIADQRHVELLPPVRTLKEKQKAAAAAAPKGCRPCQARRASRGLTDADLDAGLRTLANYLADKPEVIAQLKGLLSASTLRFKYTKAAGSGIVIRKF